MATDAQATILVVDDNPVTRYSTSRVLRSAGFDVLEAATGGDALRLAARAPDLVVLDVNLPDIDGFQVCRELRRQPVTARTPVVHLSATFVNDINKVQGLDAGADGYLTHPVEPPVLIATVKAFLRTRHAERAMRESEAKFKAVFEQALHGIALISDDLLFLDVNPAMARLIGTEVPAMVGKHLSAFLPVASEDVVEQVACALTQSGQWQGILPLLHHDGHPVDLEWTVSTHSDPNIRVAIIADITARRELEAERERLLASERAARAEAERANATKDEFLAALSHELRTPLNAIVGWSQVLKRMPEGAPDFRRGIDAIERNARVQAQLIADLLDVSRITSGKLNLDVQPFDPAEAVDSAIASMRPMALARNVTIVEALTTPAEPLRWDPARFQQVVWNLLDNAIKFSDTGGTVHLSLTDASDPAAVVLTVRDTGRGIVPAFLPRVFDRFGQEDATTRRTRGGLGLGLAIVKQLVEAHGGTITVHSAGENQGATFVVTMPKAWGWQATDAGGGGTSHPLDGTRVLVVEDDDDARTLVSRVLRDAHAIVCEAADVAQALGELERFDPHVMVSDVGMPRADGYDLIREVRASRPAERLPAVALTAFARDEDRARVLAAGYQRHLAKPLNAIRLLEVVFELAGTVSGHHDRHVG